MKGRKPMNIDRIIKVWKSEEYRESLSAEERALLPENPAGEIELNESELQSAIGGDAVPTNPIDCSVPTMQWWCF
jgi:mersacidin/lichenicidin family type 2 lantibiotic